MLTSIEKKLTVLIIGCGNIAGGFDASRASDANPLTHASAFNQHGKFNLVACVDPDKKQLSSFKEAWGVSEAFSSLDSIKDRINDFDVISICSPTHFHSEHLEMALHLSPRIVFCEKPVTPSLIETTKWIRKFKNAGILFAVNYTRRWAPDIQKLHDDITSKKWGELRSIAGHYNKGILNNGGHMVDLIHYFIGPLKVEWSGQPVWDFWKNDPSVSTVLRSNKGIYITLNTSDARDYSFFELQITMEKGVILMENGGMNWRIRQSIDSEQFRGYRTLSQAKTVKGEYNLAMRNAVNNIYEAVLHGTQVLSNGQTAAQTQKTCEKIRGASNHAS